MQRGDGARAGAPGAGPPEAEPSAERAHEALLSERRYQFQTDLYVPPPPSEPGWFSRLLDSPAWDDVGAVLRVVFWAGLALGAAALLFVLGRAALRVWQQRRAREAAPEPEAYAPAPSVARTLLDDAARLAAEGRYGDAVRLILRRSIEDMERQRPGAVRDAMTSREVARLPILGPAAAAGFSRIAALVEAAHFAGQALSAAEYEEARTTYQALAKGSLA